MLATTTKGTNGIRHGGALNAPAGDPFARVPGALAALWPNAGDLAGPAGPCSEGGF